MRTRDEIEREARKIEYGQWLPIHGTILIVEVLLDIRESLKGKE